MVKNYRFLSEIVRTQAWMMEPGMFEYYRGIIQNARSFSITDAIEWEETRDPQRLLILHAGGLRPEEKLIQTNYVKSLDYWGDINPDDQVIDILPLTGAITHGGAPCAFGTRELADRFLYADAHASVIGHLIILDTSGGEANANDLDQVLSEARKPVVGLIRGMNCSKGVWISSFIPHVFAERADVKIGCIGTLAAIEGKRNGVDRDNTVHYEVYADNSKLKNIEVREAIENDNLAPTISKLNELDNQFRQLVKSRWPGVPEEKLTGAVYDASEVIGQMVDGIKSYGETIDFIFSLAGKTRLEKGVITPLGIVKKTNVPSSVNESKAGNPALDQNVSTSLQVQDTSREQPALTEVNNINPQKKLIPMSTFKALEKILGEGAVSQNEAGCASFNAEQLRTLDEYCQKAELAISLSETQGKTISALEKQLNEQECAIEELSRESGAPIEQPVPENDNATERPVLKGSILEGVKNPADQYNLLAAAAKELGLKN